jgi:hypothetical protein
MPSERKQWILWTSLIAILIFLGSASIWFYVQTRSLQPQSDLKTQLHELESQTDTPLYFPATLPPDFKASDEEPGFYEEEVVEFSLLYRDRRLIITQQPRPAVMEEVNKKTEFITPVGKAYIADLNGRQTGFLLAKETLVIVTSPDGVGSEQLKQALESMRPL